MSNLILNCDFFLPGARRWGLSLFDRRVYLANHDRAHPATKGSTGRPRENSYGIWWHRSLREFTRSEEHERNRGTREEEAADDRALMRQE